MNVYRLYDDAGALLYVGITRDWPRRERQHAASQSWWSEVARSTFEQYPTQSAAFRRETEIVRSEGPRHNGSRRAKPLESQARYDGRALVALRERLSWTQERMARELGVAYTTINRWENGKAVPRGLSVPALERLARRASKG